MPIIFPSFSLETNGMGAHQTKLTSSSIRRGQQTHPPAFLWGEKDSFRFRRKHMEWYLYLI
jgi:hypothetical protein